MKPDFALFGVLSAPLCQPVLIREMRDGMGNHGKQLEISGRNSPNRWMSAGNQGLSSHLSTEVREFVAERGKMSTRCRAIAPTSAFPVTSRFSEGKRKVHEEPLLKSNRNWPAGSGTAPISKGMIL